MRTVGLLRHYFLAPSETFIYDSMRAVDRYAVRVFAMERLGVQKFPCDNVVALRSLPFGLLESWLYWLTAWSPRQMRWARGVDLIHAHMGWTGPYGLGAARRAGVPLVTSFYGKDVTLLGSRDRFIPDYWRFWLQARALFARGDRFLVLSQHMQRAMVAQGCPAEKIRVVPLGVNLERFGVVRAAARPPGQLTVLMVGREVEKKGFDDGLRACARARAAGVDVRPVLLGTGSAGGGELRKLAAELGLEVAWPEPSTPVPQAMAEADVLMVPSHTARDGDQEGTPTVICEGSAARLPIVSTRHAGIPEQVEHGRTGLLAAERDVDGLAEALVELAGDPARRAAMGAAGREKMLAEYSLAAHRQRLQAVYDELLM